MTYASIDDLLAGTENPAEDVTLPSGRVVKVRSLSRGEAMRGGRLNGADAIERHMLVCGMVEPPCSPDQAEQLQQAPRESELADDVDAIVGAVMRLSGLGLDATKSGGAGDAGGSVAAVRRVDGRKARQDTGRDPGDA